jgi:hypothetical protein
MPTSWYLQIKHIILSPSKTHILFEKSPTQEWSSPLGFLMAELDVPIWVMATQPAVSERPIPTYLLTAEGLASATYPPQLEAFPLAISIVTLFTVLCLGAVCFIGNIRRGTVFREDVEDCVQLDSVGNSETAGGGRDREMEGGIPMRERHETGRNAHDDSGVGLPGSGIAAQSSRRADWPQHEDARGGTMATPVPWRPYAQPPYNPYGYENPYTYTANRNPELPQSTNQYDSDPHHQFPPTADRSSSIYPDDADDGSIARDSYITTNTADVASESGHNMGYGSVGPGASTLDLGPDWEGSVVYRTVKERRVTGDYY